MIIKPKNKFFLSFLAMLLFSACGAYGNKIVYRPDRLDYVPPGLNDKQVTISAKEFKDLRKNPHLAYINQGKEEEKAVKASNDNEIKKIVTTALAKELQRLGYQISDRAEYIVTGDINNFSVIYVDDNDPYLLSNIQLTVRIEERIGGRVIFEDYIIAGVKDSIYFIGNESRYIEILNRGLIKAMYKIIRLDKFHQALDRKD